MTTSVIIADDHSVVRAGMKTILMKNNSDIEVVAEAENGRQVLELAEKHRGCVYIMDISMPYLNGIEAVGRLTKIDPSAKVIILSMHDDRASVEKAFNSGAHGYVLKVSSVGEITQAVRSVQKGHFYISPAISHYLVDTYRGKRSTEWEKKRKFTNLTPKEREILQLLAEGNSSKEIADQLQISFNTVNVHKTHIMDKLQLHKLADLVRYAVKEGIVNP